jgi:hypothetical protein
MVDLNASRWITSEGRFGYYDGYPLGELPRGLGTASLNSGLANTWIVTKTLVTGVPVEAVFGKDMYNPGQAPLPNLADINLEFTGSVTITFLEYGVDIANLSLDSDSLDASFKCSG